MLAYRCDLGNKVELMASFEKKMVKFKEIRAKQKMERGQLFYRKCDTKHFQPKQIHTIQSSVTILLEADQ